MGYRVTGRGLDETFGTREFAIEKAVKASRTVHGAGAFEYTALYEVRGPDGPVGSAYKGVFTWAPGIKLGWGETSKLEVSDPVDTPPSTARCPQPSVPEFDPGIFMGCPDCGEWCVPFGVDGARCGVSK